MSQSRSRSRTSALRAPRPEYSRTPTVLGGEDLAADGPVTAETVEYLHEFVHPHGHQVEDTLIGEEEFGGSVDLAMDSEEDGRMNLPWWKRPSPWWLIAMLPISAMAMAATIAPRVEVYTMLACRVHKPDIYYESDYYAPQLQAFGNSTTSLFQQSQLNANVHIELAKANPCAADPVVQAAVAKLAAVMTACMGVLSCLTTGWWGSFSDRYGRVRLLGISVIGVLLTDVAFIMVYFYAEKLPGNYWFLVFGPLIEGSLGGFTSIMAAIQAYMADTSTPATRSRVFSLAMGLMFTGFAVGPTLGGILIRFTHQVISVFYVAAFSHLFYALMTWLVLPESLTKRKMELSTIKYRQQLDGTSEHTATGIITIFRRLFFFLSPLTVFLPLRVGEVKVFGRNWNLTLIALGYAFTISIMGSYTYKFQYAASEFGWSSETISYWLSLVGGARAFHLAVILPICIRLFKGKPRRPLATSSEEQEPLIHEATETQTTPTPRSTSHSPSRLTEPHSSHFDLNLARVSLFIEIIAYTCMGLATHPIAFTVFGMMGSLGTGFAPAIQSVALDLYTRGGEETETGKLFGAMSVVQALSSQILGPAMYGLIYMNTVATYPRTIFFVSVASVLISFIILAFVRLPAGTKPGTLSDVEEQLLPEGSTAREDTLVDAEDH